VGYENYTKLNDEQCEWVLSKKGAELFGHTKILLEQGKIDAETMKQMNALWLNEHNIKGKWNKYKISAPVVNNYYSQ
jgi:hypothetical protein